MNHNELLNFKNEFQKVFKDMNDVLKQGFIEPYKNFLLQFSMFNTEISKISLSSIELINSFKQLHNTYKIDIDQISKYIKSIDFSKLEHEISLEDKKEFECDLEEVVSEENWEQKLVEKYSKWKLKRPIFIIILIFIISQLASGFLQSCGSAIKSTLIREEPNKESKVIYQIIQNNQVNIIKQTSHYYQIEYVDQSVKTF